MNVDPQNTDEVSDDDLAEATGGVRHEAAWTRRELAGRRDETPF